MRYQNTFLGLPKIGLNCLCISFGITIACLGVRIARGADIALETANAKMMTFSSARRLEKLAEELDQQAKLIEQKDKAYKDLENIYKRTLKGRRGYEQLTNQIEVIEKIPRPDSVKEIKQEIKVQEDLLLESVEE